MTAARLGVVGFLLCAACNPFAVEAGGPGGPAPMPAGPAAASGNQVMSGSVMATAGPQQPVPARSAGMVATGDATSPETAAAAPSAPAAAEGAQQGPGATPSEASAAEPSAPAGAPTEAAPPAEPSASSTPESSAPAEGSTPPAGTEGTAGTEGAAETTDPVMTTPVEDGTGRAKGTAPLGTPLEEGGMECTNEVCLPLPALDEMASSMGFTLTLCCTPEGECGTISNDEPCRVIPDSDPNCPRLDVMNFEIASCCTEDGKCGLNGEALMMKPCGSLEEAIEMFGDFIEFPEPRACTPSAATPPSTPPAGEMPAGGMTP